MTGPVSCAPATGTTVEAVSVLTGWGHGTRSLPADAARAAEGRSVISLPRPALDGERFRRATRECLLGVAAVDLLLRESAIARDMIRGSSTNQAFIVAGSSRPARTEGGLMEKRSGSASSGSGPGGTYFPYTAPSAMAGEVAIEFGLTGPYGILIGGAAATIDALWQATRLLTAGRCARALVLAVETFEECAGLFARGRWLVRRPLVEAAACALLVPGAQRARYDAPRTPSALETLARVRAGETLACGPLIALALAREDSAAGPVSVSGEWRGRRAGLHWQEPNAGAR